MALLLFPTKENVANTRTEAAGNLICMFYIFRVHLLCFHPHLNLVNSPLWWEMVVQVNSGLKTLTKREDLINFYLTIYF